MEPMRDDGSLEQSVRSRCEVNNVEKVPSEPMSLSSFLAAPCKAGALAHSLGHAAVCLPEGNLEQPCVFQLLRGAWGVADLSPHLRNDRHTVVQ